MNTVNKISGKLSTSKRQLFSAFLAIAISTATCANIPGQAYVIVLNSNDDSISLIDPGSYEEIKRIHIGKGPHHLLPNPEGDHLVVGNTKNNELVIIHPETGRIVKRIPGIADPYHIGFSLDGQYFVVNGNRTDHVDIYRHHSLEFKLLDRLTLLYRPNQMAFDHGNTVLYY